MYQTNQHTQHVIVICYRKMECFIEQLTPNLKKINE